MSKYVEFLACNKDYKQLTIVVFKVGRRDLSVTNTDPLSHSAR